MPWTFKQILRLRQIFNIPIYLATLHCINMHQQQKYFFVICLTYYTSTLAKVYRQPQHPPLLFPLAFRFRLTSTWLIGNPFSFAQRLKCIGGIIQEDEFSVNSRSQSWIDIKNLVHFLLISRKYHDGITILHYGQQALLVKHKYIIALKKVQVTTFCVVDDRRLNAINLQCSIVTQHISPLVNSHFWSLDEVPLSVKYLFTSLKL